MVCSKCKLVKYCSRTCQAAHWPIHKKDCKHPYNKADWQPGWQVDDRVPTWMFGNEFQHLFGNSVDQYLWGNIPAIDVFHLPTNEGASASHRDFKICFAASGDLRNVVRTINGLPDDYTGKCRILINDHSPCVTTRNVLILFALLRAGRPVEEAAETAMHLWYSAFLRAADASEMYFCAERIYGDVDFESSGTELSRAFPLRGKGQLHIKQPLEKTLPFMVLLSTYDTDAARESMHAVTLAPSRLDYRDRHLSGLKPAHRVAWARNRIHEVLVPLSHFQEPNRTMYSPNGQWLTLDNADKLHGWPIQDVLESGRRSGRLPADIYGCLHAHVHGQLIEMARRIERFRIDIHITQRDVNALAVDIAQGVHAPFFSVGSFDRIETANVADYVGLGQILERWSPLLRRENKHACLLAYTMNWHVKRPGSSASGMGHIMSENRASHHVQFERTERAMGFKTTGRPGAKSAAALAFIDNMAAFCDTTAAFRRWLDEQGLPRKSRQLQ
ncbi:hypothetical protein HDZ31DRAFT_64397 [Schizophyllum fasciatum]